MESLKEFLRPEVIWCLIGLLLLLLEFVMPGLIIAFFGLGAWVVALVCVFMEIDLTWQLGIFIAASVISLLLLRRAIKGVFFGHVKGEQDLSEDLKEFIGEKVVTRTAISPSRPGKVEFHGTDWNAESDEEISEGMIVEIIDKDNLTLKVRMV